MPEPLIGASQMPDMNILQLLLEGPRGYFGRRGQMADQLFLQNQQEQRSGQFAKGLLQTPEFNTAMDNPYDRRAQYSLWANTMAGPQNIQAQGANWLQTSIQGIYGREASTFEDALQKSRIRMTTDEALRLEQGKMDIANRQLSEQWNMIFGQAPDGSGMSNAGSQFVRDQKYNFVAKNLGLPLLPEGYSIGGENGVPALVPTPGGKPWQEMTEKLNPLQRINGAVDELAHMMETGTMDTGRVKQLTQMIQDDIRKGGGFGSLDAGTQEAMANYIDQYGAITGYGANPVGSKNWNIATEKLRGLKITTQQNIEAWKRQYQLDPMSPKIGDPYKYTPPAEKVKLPEMSADEAMEKKRDKTPAGSVGAGGLPDYTVPSLLDEGDAERKARANTRREEFKKRNPGFKYGK